MFTYDYKMSLNTCNQNIRQSLFNCFLKNQRLKKNQFLFFKHDVLILQRFFHVSTNTYYLQEILNLEMNNVNSKNVFLHTQQSRICFTFVFHEPP